MEDEVKSTDATLCPSAQPEMEGSIVFGVVGGSVEQPRLGYLVKAKPVTEELLNLSGQVRPTEVFRFAAPCANSSCQHFDGASCRLVARTVQLLPIVVGGLPACVIRASCRWWLQEGKEACLRCPQIVTEMYQPTQLQHQAADPEA